MRPLSFSYFEEASFENNVKNLINIYLLFDSFKIAFINLIYESFGINQCEGFYISTAIIGLFNFMKLLWFSFTFVYLQTTLIELVDKCKFKIIKKDKLKHFLVTEFNNTYFTVMDLSTLYRFRN